jgi:hypothetical protein
VRRVCECRGWGGRLERACRVLGAFITARSVIFFNFFLKRVIIQKMLSDINNLYSDIVSLRGRRFESCRCRSFDSVAEWSKASDSNICFFLHFLTYNRNFLSNELLFSLIGALLIEKNDFLVFHIFFFDFFFFVFFFLIPLYNLQLNGNTGYRNLTSGGRSGIPFGLLGKGYRSFFFYIAPSFSILAKFSIQSISHISKSSLIPRARTFRSTVPR